MVRDPRRVIFFGEVTDWKGNQESFWGLDMSSVLIG